MIVSDIAVGSYLLILAVVLAEAGAKGGYEFEALNRTIAILLGLCFGIPTVVLAVLLFVRRIARPVGLVLIAWMALSGFLWLPHDATVSAFALVATLVIVLSVASGWKRG